MTRSFPRSATPNRVKESGRAAGEPEGIANMYADMAGDEVLIRDQVGEFACKRLPT